MKINFDYVENSVPACISPAESVTGSERTGIDGICNFFRTDNSNFIGVSAILKEQKFLDKKHP